MIDPYEKLANAIILQAVEDWRKAARALRRNPEYKDARVMLDECEQFFHSDWFGVLTNLDGDSLLRRLRQEVRK